MVYHDVASAGQAVRGFNEHSGAPGVDELQVGQIQVDFLAVAGRQPKRVVPENMAAQVDASGGAQAHDLGATAFGDLQRTVELVLLGRRRGGNGPRCGNGSGVGAFWH